MTAPTSRGDLARAWLSRLAFGGAILALLGTSRPSWSIPAALPDSGAPRSGTATRITVEASSSPTVRYTNRLGSRMEPSSVPGRDGPPKAFYLLPPGATLDAVEIRGHECASGGGACSKCMPPPGVFVRATTETVHVWTNVDTLETKLEAAPSTTSALPHIAIVVSGDPRNFEVVLRGKTDRDRLGTWEGKPVQATCRGVQGDAGIDAVCSYYVFAERPLKHVEADVVVEVTSFGECLDSQRPCTARAGTDGRIRSAVLGEGP